MPAARVEGAVRRGKRRDKLGPTAASPDPEQPATATRGISITV